MEPGIGAEQRTAAIWLFRVLANDDFRPLKMIWIRCQFLAPILEKLLFLASLLFVHLHALIGLLIQYSRTLPFWWSGFWIRSSNATQCSSNHAFGHSIKEYLRNWLLPLPGSALRRQFEFRRVRVRMGLATIHDKLLDFWTKSVSYTQMFSHIIYNKSEILHWRLIILTYFSYLHRWWFTISVNQNKM